MASPGGEALLRDARRLLETDSNLLGALFSDPQVYELEKRRLFARSWVFVGHESEIPQAHDYMVRYVVDDAFIVLRDGDGQIRAHYNMCRHRGMTVCRTEAGNSKRFQCPYHGWTYDASGRLAGVPFEADAYGKGRLDRDQWGLMPAPGLDSIFGMIFVSLDENAPPLRDYLQGAEWYLALYLDKSDAGMEVRGAPQRWIVPANWKLATENFIGDAYHTGHTHVSTVESGALPVPGRDFHKEGVHAHTGPWGGGFLYAPPEAGYLFYGPEVTETMRRRLTPEHASAILDTGLALTHSAVMPNLSFLNAPGAIQPGGAPVPFLTVKCWRPIAPDRIEVWSWFMVEKDASEAFKEASYRAYVHSFGASGVLEQDDAENWQSITERSKGLLSRQVALNYQMGLNHLEPDADWPGPGTAYPLDYAEYNQRHFWRKYFDYMLGDAA